MSERFPVQSTVEQSISQQVNGLVGSNDINLNTIYKMSLLNAQGCVDISEMTEVLQKIREANLKEHELIQREYELTYDSAGEIVLVDDIDERKKSQKDTPDLLPESGGGEQKVE
jgi:hypothetical protein